MLMGFSDSIRIEDPPFRGRVRRDEWPARVPSGEAGQSIGKWSLAALAAEGYGTDSGDQEHPVQRQDRFVFASGSDAQELGELSGSPAGRFLRRVLSAFLAANEKKELFDKLCGYWACDAAMAYERLQRIQVRSIGEIELEQKVRWGLRLCFSPIPWTSSPSCRRSSRTVSSAD